MYCVAALGNSSFALVDELDRGMWQTVLRVNNSKLYILFLKSISKSSLYNLLSLGQVFLPLYSQRKEPQKLAIIPGLQSWEESSDLAQS